MGLVALFVTATKLAGVLVTATVAANCFSFSRYRRKHLHPFISPVDESSDTLAVFNINAEGEDRFFFGLATAPAHVEDRLNDAWLQFAEEHPCYNSESQRGLMPADAVIGSAAADGGSHEAQLTGKEARKATKRKKKKPLKVSMEAMIRGFQKFEEE